MAQLTFTPPPHELPYYDGLFSVADQARAGALGGKEAVGFLSLSKLPVDLLRNIWAMADNPKTNSLDRGKFHVAVRLIQLFQNGQKAQDAQLSAAPGVNMRPAYFQGVSGVSVQLPGAAAPPAPPPAPVAPPAAPVPPPQQQQPPGPPPPQQRSAPQQQMQQPAAMQQAQAMRQSSALVTQDPYVMHPHEQQRYENLFPQYEKPDGFVYGAEAVALFSKSGLEKDQLRDIWNIVDNPVDNRLDKLEFAIAMHLIVCISKKNLPVPAVLPPSLQALKDKARGGGHGQPQQQQPPPPPPQQQQQQAVPSQGMPSPTPQTTQQAAAPPQVQGPSMGSAMAPPAAIPSPTLAPQQPPNMQASIAIPSPKPSSQPTPGMQQQQQQQQQQYVQQTPAQQYGQAAPAPGSLSQSLAGGPPPLGASGGGLGGMSISDAFEGLNTEPPPSAYDAPPSPTPAASAAMGGYGHPAAAAPPSPELGGGMAAAGEMPEISVGGQQRQDTGHAPTVSMGGHSTSRRGVEDSSPPEPPAPPPTGRELSKSYKMEDDSGEVVKLRATLQKLQAENISLKAKLGDVSEEEKEVRREINATVAEIGKLSQELTGLREKVGAAKASLIEATAELKAQQEKRGMTQDLIADAEQTLDALETANESIQDLKDSAAAIEQKQAAANAAGSHFESDLFGFDGPPAAPPAPVNVPAPEPVHEPVPAPVPVPAPPVEENVQHYDAPAPPPAPVPPPGDGLMGGTGHSGFSHEEPAHYPTPAPMGGTVQTSAPALGADAFGHNAPPAAQQASSHGPEDIENLKQQAAKMDEIAREAEGMQRQLHEKCDNLRQIAEQAENEAKEKMTLAQEKKKKKFGGGGKKALKEAETAQKDAEEKRKHATNAQGELTNAQAQSIKAKRAAEDMRQQAEQAELQAASALSVVSQVTDDQRRRSSKPGDSPSPAYPGLPPASPMSGMGYGSYESADKGMGASGSMGSGRGMAMGGGVMGGGGGFMGSMSSAGGEGGGIPTPTGSENGDAYNNPFGGF